MNEDQYYYTEEEWARLGLGPLPRERDIRYKDINYQDISWCHNVYAVYPNDDSFTNPYGQH